MPVHLLFGRTRWARRRGVAALLRGRRDVAYVMGTQRKREQLLRELTGTPTGAVRAIEPASWVFGQLTDELVRRFVDDRASLPEAAAIAVWVRLLAERGDPRAPADLPTARALSAALEAWEAEGRWPDDPAARALLLAGRAALDALPGHRRATARLRLLLGALQDPGEPLRRWLARHPAVVVDDLCGTSPLESAVVTALCAAWSAAGATVVCAFASGADRGGREIAWALGVDPPEDREALAFAATAHLRRRAFDDLIATGLADCFVAGPLGVREVELLDEDGAAAPPDLADAAAIGAPLEGPLQSGGLSLGPHADPEEEARWVAGRVASLLRDGLAPAEILVAVGDPATEPTLLRVLDEAGVPWARGGGRRVGPVPAVRAARALLALPSEGWPLDALADVVVAAGLASPSLLPRLRSAGVRSSDPEVWGGPLAGWAARTGTDPGPSLVDREAVRILRAGWPAMGPADAATWTERLRHGFAAIAPPGPGSALVAEALGSVALALGAAGGTWEAAAVRAVVDEVLLGLCEPVPDDGLARVPVVGVREILGLTPRHVFLVGLRAGAWGAPPPRGPWDPERGVGREPVAVARYLLHSLLRDAVGDPWIRSVHLSWPAAVDGRPQRPAPLLAEIADLPVGRGTLADHLPHPPGPPPSLRPTAADALAARVAASRRGPPGARDGLLGHPLPSPGSLPVTALETYLRCPHRYWVRHQLGIDALPAEDPELDARRRGTAVHAILEAFWKGRGLRPLRGEAEPTAARRALHAVAVAVLDEIAAEGGADPLFLGWARSRWVAGLVDDRPAGLLRVWLDQEFARPDAEPEALERPFRDLPVGPVTLRGVIDRVDRVGSAHLVVDYKTGRPPTRADVMSGRSLQPFAYLWAVPAPAAACFQVLGRPDRLARTTFVGDEAALDRVCSPAERRAARVVGPAEREAVLRAAGDAAERMLAGDFPPTPWEPEEAGCSSCPYRAACRSDLRHRAAG